MKFRDVELLSEYLDGRLSPSDAARLEARLASDASLKTALSDMRETRGLIRRLPQRRAPRNFRLTPKMAGVRPPTPRAYPAFRLATALAAFLFLASVALNAFTPFAAQRFAPVAAPALGKGGGGPAESSEAAPAATEAPLQQPFAAAAPTPTAESPAAADLATAQAVQTQDALRPAPTTEANQAAPVSPPNPLTASPQPAPAPIPVPWVIGLGVVMIVCAAAAWLLRLNNERRIRNRWNQK